MSVKLFISYYTYVLFFQNLIAKYFLLFINIEIKLTQ